MMRDEPQPRRVEPYYCPNCGVALQHAHKFCPHCGAAIRRASVPYWLRGFCGLALTLAAVGLAISGTCMVGTGGFYVPGAENGNVRVDTIGSQWQGFLMLIGAAFCIWAGIKLMK